MSSDQFGFLHPNIFQTSFLEKASKRRHPSAFVPINGSCSCITPYYRDSQLGESHGKHMVQQLCTDTSLVR